MRFLILCLTFFSLFSPRVPLQQAPITTRNDRARVSFPESVTFSVDLSSSSPIEKVLLEYGSQQDSCGEVVAVAFPQVKPGTGVHAEWTWEMKKSGSQPPGASLWWRWKAQGAGGTEFISQKQTVTWLDSSHPWQTVRGGDINLHYYAGGNAFATELQASALKSLADLTAKTGLKPQGTIDLYIYNSSEEMRQAMLYQPAWTGGLAFPGQNIIIIGISPDIIDWGKKTQAHEITHVLVGKFTFSCLGEVPTWLNEGLAVMGEGGMDDSSVKLFNDAVSSDSLLSVRALSGGFSEDPNKADISYSQSYSLVSYLVEKYGREKLDTLLTALRDGTAINEAMLQVYSIDLDGFDRAWREKIGAKTTSAPAQATPTPAPTQVPTLVPFSGLSYTPGAVSITRPPAQATPTFVEPPSGVVTPPGGGEDGGGFPNWLVTALLVCGGLVGLAVLVAGFILLRRQRK